MDKSVKSTVAGAGARHLDMGAARAATKPSQPMPAQSDAYEQADDPQTVSNGVDTGMVPASISNQIRPGGGHTP